ncbi:hypothetical protein GT347_19470 [Xylophilus rhododendri]|uniref:Uncharacterized protein n=1 Tax=Xylophilus rhododendri TaxID=2697032 RepID=A0A857JB70_9BURK|nr:hypothetical protein [Xylophilus rhododendri]QHI99965.1 hypothetical protein GT347_19470 [Xylophilus rhododendri]
MIQVFRSFSLACAAAALLLAASGAAVAQERIYRCGNEYTNNAAVAKQRDCKVMEGGNVTIVQGTRASGGSGASGGNVGVVTAPVSNAARIDADQQRARDADARSILENELRRAQARQAELQKEYNNGEPERQGAESRNYQKYLDRVADLKASIARNQSDMEGIQRELARLQTR